MSDAFLVPGFRTAFVKAGGAFAKRNAIELSVPLVKAMAARAAPDFVIWGQVIPDPTMSNIARELIFEAKLSPNIPAFSTVMACSTSFIGTIEASGMVGHGDFHLALVGGVETMSHVPLALKPQFADSVLGQFAKNPAAALETLQKVTPQDFDLPIHGWANRQSGRSMGEHTEDTAKYFAIPRADQDKRALLSHQSCDRRAGHRLLQRYRPSIRWRRSRLDSTPRHLVRETCEPQTRLRPQRHGHADGR